MGLVELPILTKSATIAEATTAMRYSRRSGVVVRDGSGVWLIDAAALAHGASKGVTAVGQVERRRALHVPSLDRLAADKIDMTDPLRSTKLRGMLDEGDHDYALLAVGDAHAIVISRDKSLIRYLEPAPRACYCLGTLASGEPCPETGTKTGDTCGLGHTGMIYCLR